jgi:hypothetical protein
MGEGNPLPTQCKERGSAKVGGRLHPAPVLREARQVQETKARDPGQHHRPSRRFGRRRRRDAQREIFRVQSSDQRAWNNRRREDVEEVAGVALKPPPSAPPGTASDRQRPNEDHRPLDRRKVPFLLENSEPLSQHNFGIDEFANPGLAELDR